MAIKEVFPNPTVEQVSFEIRFSNLFYIENKIGELQIKLINEFPDSDLIFSRKMVLVNQGDKARIEIDAKEAEESSVQKIWQFRSPKDYKLNVLSNSLSIISELHKTYNNPKGEHRFRDIIELVLSNFIAITNLPLIKRIGLRYIDKCPVPAKDNSSFKKWYNSSFPLTRFNLSDAEDMMFQTVTKKDSYFLRYIERFKKIDDNYALILDLK